MKLNENVQLSVKPCYFKKIESCTRQNEIITWYSQSKSPVVLYIIYILGAGYKNEL